MRDYVDVEDLIDAHIAVMEKVEPGTCVALNVGGGEGRSVLDIIHTAEGILGREVPWKAGPARAGDPPRLVADARKIREGYGWRPRRTLEESLQKASKWLLDPSWRH